MKGTWGLRAVASAAIVIASGCVLKTDIVAGAFNGGALQSVGDPFRDPIELRASRVERIVEQEMTDGYFRQGSDGDVAGWLDTAASHVGDFANIVGGLCKPIGSGVEDAGPGVPDDRKTKHAIEAKRRAHTTITNWLTTDVAAPICTPQHTTDDFALERFLDGVRFEEAVWRAARRVSALKLEGVIANDDIERGAKVAFQRAASYVRARHWKRKQSRRTLGVAVEGGAAQGIFAAGAVWTVLNLINQWMEHECKGDRDCEKQNEIRFELISGTSTGAMISVAVDRFNAMTTKTGRDQEINNIAKWFTCYSFSDLMCGQSASLFGLTASTPSALRGVLKFDGIEKVLTSCVEPWTFDNFSELILNTTEFRTGRIFALSDQNEMKHPPDVVHAALASALLPVIGDPDRNVWDGVSFDTQYDAGAPAATEPVYLDGGIRSELPVLPLVRRGAERVLAVASGGSTVTEVGQLKNAIAIAGRYININTGAVMETELEYAQRLAESMRQDEVDACWSALEKGDTARCNVVDGCNPWNVCHGRYDDLCKMPSKEWPKYARDAQEKFGTLTLQQRLTPFWQMESIFMDESNVDGLAGYDFNPSDLRRLFRAGAETVRMRCPDIAHLLGIVPAHSAASPEDLARINQFCAVRMPAQKAICGKDPAPPTGFVLRSCTTPPPPELDACTALAPDVPK